MKIIENYNLVKNNTFGLSVFAKRFVEFDEDNDILEYLRDNPFILNDKFLIIGEGSNLLFVDNFLGTIIHPITENINIINEDAEYLYVEASAGVIWDKFVEWTLLNNAFGLENLSLIPGSVGASAVQNIGAYGVEAGDFIESVRYLNLENLQICEIKSKDCFFDYRNSIFKNQLSAKTLILSVVYRLQKAEKPITNYADIKAYFGDNENITSLKIREAVIDIRNRKLPDPNIIGNAGSFFKNPIVDKAKLDDLILKFPDIRFYKISETSFKLAAGWMIDQCGFKSFTHKGAGVHDNQALVLINKNQASGKDIVELAQIIKNKILEVFGVLIMPEVIFV